MLIVSAFECEPKNRFLQLRPNREAEEPPDRFCGGTRPPFIEMMWMLMRHLLSHVCFRGAFISMSTSCHCSFLRKLLDRAHLFRLQMPLRDRQELEQQHVALLRTGV